MKIIENNYGLNNDWKAVVDCSHCKSKLEIDKSDIKNYNDRYTESVQANKTFWGYESFTGFECPCCKTHSRLTFSNPATRKYVEDNMPNIYLYDAADDDYY